MTAIFRSLKGCQLIPCLKTECMLILFNPEPGTNSSGKKACYCITEEEFFVMFFHLDQLLLSTMEIFILTELLKHLSSILIHILEHVIQSQT